jgi:hypothetical protein
MAQIAKTFASLTGAAFVLLKPEEIAALSRVELERLTIRSRALIASIATYIKTAETATTTVTTTVTTTETAVTTTTITTTTKSTMKFDIQAEAEVLKVTPQELAVLSTHDLEQLVLRTQAVMRRCPFKSGCSFCSLPDEYVLDILLTWITIEDLAHFDNALLNHMDRRVHLSLLRDTEHRGVLSESESCYKFDSGVAVWLESRNVFMRELSFHDGSWIVTIPTGFLARTGQQLLSLDLDSCSNISDTVMHQLLQTFPRLEEISLSECFSISDTTLAFLVQHCPRINTLNLNLTRISDAGLAILAQACRALKQVDLHELVITDSGVCRLAEGCPDLEQISFRGAEITDAAFLSLLRHCPQLRRLDLKSCDTITGDGLSRLHIGEGGRSMKVLKLDCVSFLTDSGLGNIAECCPNIEIVHVTSCEEITDTGFAELLRRCPRLHTVEFSDIKITCEGLDRLGEGGKALKTLILNDTVIFDAGLAKLAEACVNLEHLDLTSNIIITDAALASLSEACVNLKHLILTSCSSITDEGLATLARSSLRLQILRLDSTAITEAGLIRIGDGFKDLKELFLRSVRLTDSGLGKIATACPNLEHVALYGVQLTDGGVTRLVERCSRLRIVELAWGSASRKEALARLREAYPALQFN